MKANKVIACITAALVVFLTGCAFYLSYSNLRSLAEDSGLAGTLGLIWPLTLDAFMIAAGLSVLYKSIGRQPTRKLVYPWMLVGAFTALSIGFNIVQAPETLLAQAIYALPAGVVFLGLELLSSQIKDTVDVEPTQVTPPSLQINSVERLLLVYSDKPTASHSELAGELGESRQWVTAKLRQLEAAGKLEDKEEDNHGKTTS